MGMCAIHGPRVMDPASKESVDDSPRSGGGDNESSSCSHDESAFQEVTKAANPYDQHPALWKRTIPKGRRCEPLAFSGVILYDEHGNRLHHYNHAAAMRRPSEA